MRLRKFFFDLILELGLVVLVFPDIVPGEACGATTRAKPGDNLTVLRAKAIDNFRSACRLVKKNHELCSFTTEPSALHTATYILKTLKMPFLLDFTVRTGGDAAVVIAEETELLGPTAPFVTAEILIGSVWNSQASIRTCVSVSNCVPVLTTYEEDGMLSDVERRPFWVEYRDDGVLAVGKGGHQQPFMTWDLSAYFRQQPISEIRVGIASWGSVAADWVFYQFCD